jgi:hypothetical protein
MGGQDEKPAWLGVPFLRGGALWLHRSRARGLRPMNIERYFDFWNRGI